MNARLAILLTAAISLAIFFAVRSPASVEQSLDDGSQIDSDVSRKDLLEMQTVLRNRPLPGETPASAPQLDIRLEVDTSGKKNRIYFYLSEAQGYYVEEFNINFYYKQTPDTDFDSSDLAIPHVFQNYITAGVTLESCIEVTYAELNYISGDMGTTENWGVEIASHGRYRAKNPDKLPMLPEVSACLEVD